MSKLLLDESAQTYQPTLAAWIGLNEAIFIQQLHYILTKNGNVGRVADGKKWYRDKPRDFMVKYFPFWDESIVKRTMANLKEDALILARSDLNTKAKDRSLWYTVNYPALERLTGPVERITAKSAKRKEARSARRTEADRQPENTKVQNVLTKNRGTNSTLESQQNVLLTEVQNVPTPKEYTLPKDSKPKDKSGKPPAQLVFVEVTGRHVLNNTQIKAIDERVGRDPPALERWRETVTAWQLRGYKINNIDGMLEWFRKGIPEYKNGATNGTHRQTHNSGHTGRTGYDLEKEPTVNIYDDT